MPDYDNTNSGAMFFEQDPESDRHPNYKGSINVDGKDYWLSAWDKVSKSGKNYISISVKAKEPRSEGKDSQAWRDAGAKLQKNDVTDTQVPIVGTIENGNVTYDEPINLDDIPF